MRMRINTGSIDVESLDKVKSEAGASALNSLMSKIVEFYKVDKDKKSLDERLSGIKSNIVELMKSVDVDTIEHKGIRCKLASRINKTIDEESLLKYCKSLNIDGLVKTVEIIDMDVLENLIYTKQIEAESVDKFIIKTTTQFPKISGSLREDI